MILLRHALVVTALLVLTLGIPLFATGYPQRLASGTDAVSAATVVLAQPSGAYVVLINRERHPDAEKLATWVDFFNGKDIGFLFEDISCIVASGDAAGQKLARSFQSRLPENQMKVRTEDATLLLSKAEYGKYDVLLLSKEAFDAYQAEELLEKEDAEVIEAGRE